MEIKSIQSTAEQLEVKIVIIILWSSDLLKIWYLILIAWGLFKTQTLHCNSSIGKKIKFGDGIKGVHEF